MFRGQVGDAYPNGRTCRPSASGAGRSELPIRNRSIPRAAWRPSAMAQTIRLWPRVISPAVKTLGTFVLLDRIGLDVLESVELDSKLLEEAAFLGADEAHREQDKLCGINPLGSRNLDEIDPAVVCLHFNIDCFEHAHVPFSPRNRLVLIENSALPPFLVGRRDAEDIRPLRPGIRAAIGRPVGAGRFRIDERSCSHGDGLCPGSRRRCLRRR